MSEIPKEWVELKERGFAIHFLRPRSKIPIEKGWSEKPGDPLEVLEKKYTPGLNAGIKLGRASKLGDHYAAVLDVDVKSPDKEKIALKTLLDLFPQCEGKVRAISGRGNGSSHFFVRVKEPTSGNEIVAKGEDWEIQLLCQGRQVVAVGSIHPETGRKYEWKVKPNGSIEDFPIIEPIRTNSAPKKPEAGVLAPASSLTKPCDLEKIVSKEDYALIVDGIGASDESADVFQLIQSLLRQGIHEDHIRWIFTNPDFHLGQVSYRHAQSQNINQAIRWLNRYHIEKIKRDLDVFDYELDNVIEIRKDLKAPKLLQCVDNEDLEPSGPVLTLVDNLLGEQGISSVFGQPGSGKTFYTAHMAHCIATGQDFFGRKVKKRPVIFVAAEAPYSVKKRFYGMKLDSGKVKIPLTIVTETVRLSEKTSLERLMATIAVKLDEFKANECVVFIDTLSAAFSGIDQNDAKAMSAVVAQCQKIQERFNAHVCLIHHAGKDQDRGLRGSSAFNAACDTTILVDDMIAEVKKQKDGETGESMAFELVNIEAFYADDIENIPVLKELNDEFLVKERKKSRKPPDQADQFFDILESLVAQGQENILLKNWAEAVRGYRADLSANSLKMAFKRAKKQLGTRGYIKINGPYVTVIKGKKV